jgi:hypothetical protein
MVIWATVTTLAMGGLAYFGEPSSTLTGLAEIGGVVALFTLVCAAEAFSQPKN